jgi:hypothetical protein
MTDLSGASWRKSSFSMGSADCVEVAQLTTGEVAVRDSKHQLGPVLMPLPTEWEAFLAGVKIGEFDIHL